MLRRHRTRTSPSTADRSLPLLAIAVIGGDGCQCAARTHAASIRLFSSSNDGGNARLRVAGVPARVVAGRLTTACSAAELNSVVLPGVLRVP